MLKFKHNVLFIIVGRNHDVSDCINSCLSQKNINPYLYIIHNEQSDGFFRSKTFCKNPTIYEYNVIIGKKEVICLSEQENTDFLKAISFGLENKCRYFCFIYAPTVINENFCSMSIEQIKEEVVGTYGNLIDSGVPMYTHIDNNNNNIGPVFLIGEKYARMFNHQNIGDYVKNLSEIGPLYHFDDFLMENSWIKIHA